MTSILDPLAYKHASQAASLASREGDMAAEMEDIAAMQRETDRKLDLARAVSSTRAKASGSGILTNVGSPLSVIEEQIRQEKTDTERDKFNTKIAAQSARYSAAAKSGQIRGAAGLRLLQSAESAAVTAGSGGSIK